MRFLRKIKRFLVNLASYAAFQFKYGDEDWDHHYLFQIMKWKMARMANYIEKKGLHESANADAKQIRYAIFLIDRILNDHYMDELEDAARLQLGESSYQFKPKFMRKFHDAKNDADQDRLEAEYTKLMWEYDAKQRKLKERLFKHMNLYIERWWD